MSAEFYNWTQEHGRACNKTALQLKHRAHSLEKQCTDHKTLKTCPKMYKWSRFILNKDFEFTHQVKYKYASIN
jgi:hypothetical protein